MLLLLWDVLRIGFRFVVHQRNAVCFRFPKRITDSSQFVGGQKSLSTALGVFFYAPCGIEALRHNAPTLRKPIHAAYRAEHAIRRNGLTLHPAMQLSDGRPCEVISLRRTHIRYNPIPQKLPVARGGTGFQLEIGVFVKKDFDELLDRQSFPVLCAIGSRVFAMRDGAEGFLRKPAGKARRELSD